MGTNQKRLVVDRQHMIAMVSDPELYQTCPFLADIRDTALLTAQQYEESKARRCCGGDWNIIRAVVDGLCAVLQRHGADDRASLELVRDYLERKKGYRPVPVVIYYRSSKSGKPVKFQF